MSIDLTFGGRLRAPLIAAPMFLVSQPKLALACCGSGIIGSFPAHSTRTRDDFEEWLVTMQQGLAKLEDQGKNPAPYAVNLVVHRSNQRYEGDLELCIQHKVPIILTSKGAPSDVFDRIHDYGAIAFHDVASKRHAEKALQAGADGVIAVCGGAGGHTGTLNPFALVNEIRTLTDKPIILAGALSTGRDILAAQIMGADMAYMGTRFIACPESLAPEAYRQLIVDSAAKDIFYTTALDGMPVNFLTATLLEAGLDLRELAMVPPGEVIDDDIAKGRYKRLWSAGQGVGMTHQSRPAAEVCEKLIEQYQHAKLMAVGRLTDGID